ncbi:MAG: hypothetical protein ACI4V4_04045 [Eubacterium sp.]
MNKKLLSLLMAVILAFSCLAVSFSAYGKIQELTVDMDYQYEIDGEDDLAWFSYTPEASGTYSFLSYNTPATEAYLFIKEVDQETDTKQYVQLAYSNSDPNYQENGHNSRQFCLTYHLEEGVKYYFAAGWYLSESRVTGIIRVKLRCDKYDNEIDRIEVNCQATLDALTDGSWEYDSSGNSYFYYNISKIVTNTAVTIYYSDGTSSSSVMGDDNVDGYSIIYNHNQSEQHWYPESDENYTGNILSVKVLNATAQISVQIITTARYGVKGKVVDLAGSPVENAQIISSTSIVVAETDSEGVFSFYSTTGKNDYTVDAENALARKVYITTSSTENKDYSDTPIAICTCEFLNDGVINAKDFALMKKSVSEEEFENQQKQFSKAINFTQQDYPELSIG